MTMNKPITNYTVPEILAEDPYKLMELFQAEYNFDIPETLDSVEDLKHAGRLLGQLANTYSYIAQLSVYAKISVRTAKRNKEDKNSVDDAIDRKAVIETFAETIEMQYRAVSRMLTIKQQINEELKMTDGR